MSQSATTKKALCKTSLCLRCTKLYSCHRYVSLIKDCLDKGFWGGAIIYSAVSLEAMLYEAVNTQGLCKKELVTEANTIGAITASQRDTINEIKWLRNAHAHPLKHLNPKSRQRLKSIRKKYGKSASWPRHVMEILDAMPTEMKWKKSKLTFLIDFYSEGLAAQVAIETADLIISIVNWAAMHQV